MIPDKRGNSTEITDDMTRLASPPYAGNSLTAFLRFSADQLRLNPVCGDKTAANINSCSLGMASSLYAGTRRMARQILGRCKSFTPVRRDKTMHHIYDRATHRTHPCTQGQDLNDMSKWEKFWDSPLYAGTRQQRLRFSPRPAFEIIQLPILIHVE